MTSEQERYELQGEIGKGGMGTVYRAQDHKLNRRIALKRIHSNLASDPMAIGRLQREASLAATLEHPNIVRIYDVIRDDQGAFITMEFISGKSLADRLEQGGPLPPYQAQAICKKVAEALSFAHSKAVVHLDVKPANILMAANGEPRLTDFGIATWTRDQGELTRELLGTPEYAAPELGDADAKPDARADVFSLGATLYAMLTGESPRVIREAEIPKAFRPLILKAVSQDPGKRQRDMDEFKKELEAVNPHQRSRLPLLVAVLAALVLAGVAAGVWFLTQGQEHPATESNVTPASAPATKPVVRETVTPARVSDTIAPEQPAQAEFDALNVLTSGKHTWAYGFFENTGKIPIEKPRVDLTFYDEKGAVAGEGFGYAEAEILEPGMRAPVSVVVKGYTKPHAKHEARVEARKLFVSTRRLARLSIHDRKLTEGDFGGKTFSARIKNDDRLPVKFAQAVVVFYDKQDKIVAVSSGYTARKELAPGEDSRVDVRVYSPAKESPARYEVFASAAVYDK
jgi:serine/threonine protein kinase